MRTKYLLSACALSALFVGCNNDEFLQEANVPQTPESMEEVVGADLASEGMKIVINNGAQTRVNGDGWEEGDVVGMGWYNIARNIYNPQNVNDWTSAKLATLRDYKIYANDKFFIDCNESFATNANIYQGAHFVYFPYEYQGQISERSFAVNPVQTGDALDEIYNKALHVSAQDFISAADVKDADGVLTKEFALAPVVNAIKVNATPDAKVKNEVMKNYVITYLDIQTASGKDAFGTNTGNMKPNMIPIVERYEETKGINYEKTFETMALGTNIAKMFPNIVRSNQLATVINNPALTLNQTAALRAFTLPTASGITDAGSHMGIYVGNGKGYNLGWFHITNNAENTDDALDKLDAALTAEGYKEVSLQDIVYRTKGEMNLDVTLSLDNFAPITDNILSVEQWNDLVALYDALVEQLGADKVAVPTFTLGADLTFTNEIKTPANKEIYLGASSKSLTVAGTVAWPTNLVTDATDKVIVKDGAILKVNSDNDEYFVLNADITNNGTIEAGAKASISNKDNNKLTNNGRVIVEYGAYVYPNATKGEIAFKVTDSSAKTMGYINDLIEKSANDEFAYVNMLMVYTTFDLDAKATSSDDNPYNPSDAKNLNSLEGVDIELYANGGITNKAATGNEYVKSITAVEGASSISDVEIVNGALTIEKEAILDVKSARKPNPKDLNLTGDIINAGNLYVNTDIYCVNVFNAETGLIDVNKARKVTYTNKNDNKGKEEANGGLGVVKDDTPVIDADAAALKAAQAINALIAQDESGSLKNKNTFVENVNIHSTDAGQKAVLEAINLWLKATGKSEITTLTVEIINDLANVNGIKLDFIN